jgi:glycosyltransferase involved in cell wall biosynthesis
MNGPRRVKVVHVITRMDFGGAQQNTLYTSANLDPERFDVLLVTGRGGFLDSDLDSHSHFRRRAIDSLVREINPPLDLLALLELAGIFAAEKPDVVHTHSSKAGILGRLAAAIAGVPHVVHTYHGFGFHDYQSQLTKGSYVWAERLCCALSERLIFVSRANWDYARKHDLGHPDRYELIRSGVRLGEYPAKIEDKGKKKASLGAGMHKPLVVSIGNLKPQKNPGDFIGAAHLVSEKHPDARFVFIGDGPLRQRMEYKIIASGLHGKLLLPGWRRDVPEILAAGDVFALTSLWEGLPRALVEAMRSGLPPVCYTTDGVADLIRDGENGFLVPPGNVTLMAERIGQLLADEGLRARLGKAAQETIGEEFDIDFMVRAQERLYLSLVGS